MTHLTVVSDRLTHIRVPRVQKPLKTGFQAKIVFDVLLTPEVREGQMTPLEVVSDRHTRMFIFLMSKNLEKSSFEKNNFSMFL